MSRSGFYYWLAAPATEAARHRVTLAGLIAEVFAHSRQTYGARRIAASLRASGYPVSRRLVRRLMRSQGLHACQPRQWRVTTLPGDRPAAVPDRVDRDFTAATPGTVLVGDITYIRTWTGWLYLATVIDLATRKVIGWAMDTHMRTELIIDAVSMAHGTGRLQPGCVFHSDRGAQYTSSDFAAALASRNMLGSMGRTGICWDNAAAESFSASLKKELVTAPRSPHPGKPAPLLRNTSKCSTIGSGCTALWATARPSMSRPSTTRSSKRPKSAGQNSRNSSRPVRKTGATPIFYTKVHNRLLRPLLAADQRPAPQPLRQALRVIDHHVNTYIDTARIAA